MLRHRSLAALVLLSLAGAACNAITGADDLTIGDPSPRRTGDGDDDDDDDGDDDGAGGTSQAAGGGAGPGSSTGAGQAVEQLVDVAGVAIADVSFYQGVKARLVSGGAPATPKVAVVAGRDALVRVFADTSGYDGGPVVVRLSIDGHPPMEVDTTLGSGVEGTLGSTVNFDVPGAMIQPGGRFRVEIRRRAFEPAPPSPAASYPSDGSFAPIGAQVTGPLRITIVPIAYDADGSERLPNTSASQVAAYEDLFRAIYPTSQLQLTVAPAVGWPGELTADGSGWGELLDAFAAFREQDGAGFDEYYYGIFNPASSAQAFCGNGCVAGLGYVGGPGDAYVRASIGLGFGGDLSTGTAVHEVGHNHGRDHAPCGTSGDGGFPHAGAKIGEWGYDIVERKLKSPSQFVDVMSYCSPTWISDYNYDAFFDRIRAVNGMSHHVPEAVQGRTYERVAVRPDGVAWLDPVTIERPPIGERRPLRVATDDGDEEEIEAAFFRYDHLEGGLYVFPQGARPASFVEIDAPGVPITVAR